MARQFRSTVASFARNVAGVNGSYGLFSVAPFFALSSFICPQLVTAFASVNRV